MPKNGSYSNAEVISGVFITFCIGLLVVMMFAYGDAARLLRGRQELRVFFTSVTSLRPDAPVRFDGVEVGRVKSIEILTMDQDKLTVLPRVGLRDLDNLPLTDAERAALRKVPQPPASATPEEKERAAVDFDAKLKKAIERRTMIELKLDVLSPRDKEGGGKRYRVDDQVRITTTLLGDTSVEISSGTGKTLDELSGAEKRTVILGVSGDFFANLARSVEQVKEILGSVGDVIGPKERESIGRALRRFDAITEKTENIVTVADRRLPGTLDKVDLLLDDAKANVGKITKSITDLQPDASRTLRTTEDAVKDLQKRLDALADEGQGLVTDVRKQVRPILEDVQYMTAHSKEDLPALVKKAKELADRLKVSADKLDAVLGTGNRLLDESYPDLRAAILSLRRTSQNAEEFTYLVKRKPWLIYAAPKGEDNAFSKPLEALQKLEASRNRFRELYAELQAIQRTLKASGANVLNAEELKRLDFLIRELELATDLLKEAGEPARHAMLPDFQRKKGALVEAPEAEMVKDK